MPGAALELHEREEIHRALVEDPQASWGLSPGECTDRRRRRRARCCRLDAPGPQRERITNELRLGRSPEAIWADLADSGAAGRPCTETIYQALYSGALDVKPSQCLRSRRCRRRRILRPRPRGPNVAQRPTAVDERAVAGHWDVDRIIGANNRPSMIRLTERQSRYVVPITMPDGYADTIAAHLRRSLTFVCGPEWANWRRLADHYDLQVWFCDPHSPPQRGQIENVDRQIRWWFPAAPTCDSPPSPKPNTPLASSTTNAAAASTTPAPPNSMVPSPCTDHQNWLSLCRRRDSIRE